MTKKTNRDRVVHSGPRAAGRLARRGFTLIELLVVLAIMAVLASLIMAAVQRVRATRMVRDSEATVAKCQSGVDNQVKSINDQVALDKQNKTADFQKLMAFCDGDADRAAALLTHARIKQAFPQSAAEVASPAGFSVGSGANVVFFPRSPAFASLQGMGGTLEQQSAALLYAALANRTIQGTTFGSDDGLGGSQDDVTLGSVSCRVYVDAWRTPIAFARFFESTELNSPEYAPPGVFKNPFDPAGKLAGWTNTTNKRLAEQQLGFVLGQPSAGAPAPWYTRQPFTFGTSTGSQHKAVVVYSAGNNRAYEILNPASDDILGYRLRKIGGRGTP